MALTSGNTVFYRPSWLGLDDLLDGVYRINSVRVTLEEYQRSGLPAILVYVGFERKPLALVASGSGGLRR